MSKHLDENVTKIDGTQILHSIYLITILLTEYERQRKNNILHFQKQFKSEKKLKKREIIERGILSWRSKKQKSDYDPARLLSSGSNLMNYIEQTFQDFKQQCLTTAAPEK